MYKAFPESRQPISLGEVSDKMRKKVATFSTLLTKIKTKQSNRKNYSRFPANLADTIPGFLPKW